MNRFLMITLLGLVSLTSACNQSCGDASHPAAKAGKKKVQSAVKEYSAEAELKNTRVCRNGPKDCDRALFLKKHKESEIGSNSRYTPGVRQEGEDGQVKPYLGTSTFK